MFKLGICLSYDQDLELTKSLSDMTNQYHRDGVFCASILKKSVFTILAKDNCDLNATSSTASMHYSTSVTILQYPTKDNQNDQYPYPAIASNKSGTKKVQSLPSSYVETMPFYLPKGPLYVPNSTTITKKYDSNEVYIQECLNEIAWLKETSNTKHGVVLPKSWSK